MYISPSDLESLKNTLLKEIEKINTNISNQDKKISNLETENKLLNDKNNILDGKINSVDSQVEILRHEFSQFRNYTEAFIANTNNTLNNHLAQIRVLDEQEKILRYDVDLLKNQRMDLENRLKKIEYEIDALE